jgi:hypothetical protein
MEYKVTYIMDDVGYGKTVSGKNEAEAELALVQDLQKHYPESICKIVSVEEIEKKEKKEK